MITELAGTWAVSLTSAFVDPGKRLFLGYLASSALIALAWLVFVQRNDLRPAFARLLERRSWWSRSARADYRVMAINAAIMMLVSPRLIGQLGVSIAVFEWLHGAFEGRPAPAMLPDWGVALLFTLTLFVVDDLSRYVVHRLLHRVPWLWAFHKVHHTATALNPLTVYRTHPVEGMIFVLRGALVHGSCTGVFVFFFGAQVSLATVLGASVFSVAFNALGANLRHSHIDLGFWRPVERLFISPAQHQLHHSIARRHHDRNFGAALALWDWLGGTHCHSETGARLQFGVAGETAQSAHTLGALYFRPIVEAAGALRLRGAIPRFARAVLQQPVSHDKLAGKGRF